MASRKEIDNAFFVLGYFIGGISEQVPESLPLSWKEYAQAIETIIELMNHGINNTNGE